MNKFFMALLAIFTLGFAPSSYTKASNNKPIAKATFAIIGGINATGSADGNPPQ